MSVTPALEVVPQARCRPDALPEQAGASTMTFQAGRR